MNSMGGGSGYRNSSMSSGDKIPSGYKAGQVQQFTMCFHIWDQIAFYLG